MYVDYGRNRWLQKLGNPAEHPRKRGKDASKKYI